MNYGKTTVYWIVELPFLMQASLTKIYKKDLSNKSSIVKET